MTTNRVAVAEFKRRRNGHTGEGRLAAIEREHVEPPRPWPVPPSLRAEIAAQAERSRDGMDRWPASEIARLKRPSWSLLALSPYHLSNWQAIALWFGICAFCLLGGVFAVWFGGPL